MIDWGLDAEDLSDQQAGWGSQDADLEDGDVNESNHDEEINDQGDMVGDSTW